MAGLIEYFIVVLSAALYFDQFSMFGGYLIPQVIISLIFPLSIGMIYSVLRPSIPGSGYRKGLAFALILFFMGLTGRSVLPWIGLETRLPSRFLVVLSVVSSLAFAVILVKTYRIFWEKARKRSPSPAGEKEPSVKRSEGKTLKRILFIGAVCGLVAAFVYLPASELTIWASSNLLPQVSEWFLHLTYPSPSLQTMTLLLSTPLGWGIVYVVLRPSIPSSGLRRGLTFGFLLGFVQVVPKVMGMVKGLIYGYGAFTEYATKYYVAIAKGAWGPDIVPRLISALFLILIFGPLLEKTYRSISP